MKTCIISFSSRPGGNCGRIAEEIARQIPGETALFDFSALTVTPCGRCAYQCFQDRERCPYTADPERAICESITESALTYFVVPNYCDYPCANFFAFNERSQCYFQGRGDLLERYLAVRKKFVVVSNTGRENFTAAFRYHVSEDAEPDILFLSARRFQHSSIRGDLMDSPEAREVLSEFIRGGGSPL